MKSPLPPQTRKLVSYSKVLPRLKRWLKLWWEKRNHTLTIKIRWVWLFFIVLALWPHPHKIVYGDPITQIPAKVSQLKTLPDTALKPVEPLVAVPVAPVVTYTASAPAVGVTACGSDPNMAYIYQHESGCRTDAIGPNGPCGLGQALPCSKLGCSLSDWECQNAWFTAYAIRSYGSTYNAYIFWVNHHWW